MVFSRKQKRISVIIVALITCIFIILINTDMEDYAYPDKWENTDEMLESGQEVLKKHETYITNIANYFYTKNDVNLSEIYLDSNDKLVNTSGIDLGNMKDEIYNFLDSCPYELTIDVDKEQVNFEIQLYSRNGNAAGIEVICFDFQEKFKKTSTEANFIKLADYWCYYLLPYV